MAKDVRISQCMIVKNEEKNIEKALSWGKAVVDEQIVVDTGSTDRTVELAEEMGAKVYHYTWHDDFGAAKNYAISQATGDWIAFLDADEYFIESDALKLKPLLHQMALRKPIPDVLICPMMHLNDKDDVFSTGVQQRIFRNVPWLRYKNPIHEMLFRKDGNILKAYHTDNKFPIYHTGYTHESFEKTKKTTRNKLILLHILEKNPQDYDNLSYLGDVYFADQELEKAKEVYERVANFSGQMLESRRNNSFCTLMRIIAKENTSTMEAVMRRTYSRFEELGGQCPDMEYWMGIGMIQKKKLQDGVYWLERSLEKLELYKGNDVLFLTGNLEDTYILLMKSYQELNNLSQVVRFCTILLKANRKQEQAIATLLKILLEDQNTTPNQVCTFLEHLYDFSDIKDVLFLLRQFRQYSYSELEELLMQRISPEKRKWLAEKREVSWNLSTDVMQEKYPQITLNNQIDYRFLTLMECVEQLSEDELVNQMRGSLLRNKQKEEGEYQLYLNCFASFPIWGELSPQKGNYQAFELRAASIKQHKSDLLWLYQNLCDNRSKQVLYGVLENWIHLENQVLTVIEEAGLPFLDIDLISSCKQRIFVDIGANERLLNGFLYNYGEDYTHIYCYQDDETILAALRSKVEECVKIELKEQMPQEIRLNDDVLESIDFLKIDIVGSAQDVLISCKRKIMEDHPKLAICTDYMYEDIWKIPRIIAEMDNSYQFYMRYYGENLIPTKFVLYAI